MRALEIFTVFSLVTMLSTVAEGAAVSGKCHILYQQQILNLPFLNVVNLKNSSYSVLMLFNHFQFALMGFQHQNSTLKQIMEMCAAMKSFMDMKLVGPVQALVLVATVPHGAWQAHQTTLHVAQVNYHQQTNYSYKSND